MIDDDDIDMELVPNPIATYLTPLVPADVASLLTENGAPADHTTVRRAAAAACVNNWDIFTALLVELHQHPDRALGVARAALADLAEMAIVGARGDGERAADYFETLLADQMRRDRRG
jgi:nucleotide-binding universal stress UspA family protein